MALVKSSVKRKAVQASIDKLMRENVKNNVLQSGVLDNLQLSDQQRMRMLTIAVDSPSLKELVPFEDFARCVKAAIYPEHYVSDVEEALAERLCHLYHTGNGNINNQYFSASDFPFNQTKLTKKNTPKYQVNLSANVRLTALGRELLLTSGGSNLEVSYNTVCFHVREEYRRQLERAHRKVDEVTTKRLKQAAVRRNLTGAIETAGGRGTDVLQIDQAVYRIMLKPPTGESKFKSARAAVRSVDPQFAKSDTVASHLTSLGSSVIQFVHALTEHHVRTDVAEGNEVDPKKKAIEIAEALHEQHTWFVADGDHDGQARCLFDIAGDVASYAAQGPTPSAVM